MTSSNTEKKYQRAGAPRLQNGFDEIVLRVHPHHKESELSGDEWRTHNLITFKKKGIVIYETIGGGSLEDTALRIAQNLAEANSALIKKQAELEPFCDQQGCHKEHVNTYLLLKTHCNHCGEHFGQGLLDRRDVRKFCAEHSNRGDCSIEDRQSNYEFVQNKEDE